MEEADRLRQETEAAARSRPWPRHRPDPHRSDASHDAQRRRRADSQPRDEPARPEIDVAAEVEVQREEDPADTQVQDAPPPVEAELASPRRSGRRRQPPQWYTPPPQ